MSDSSKVKVEVTAGKGIAEAFDKAAEVGCAEISLNIPVPQNFKEATALDKLRTRGTPLELIGSCLVAGDPMQAEAAFRSCVLEHVYERLAEKYNATCIFEGKGVLKAMKEGEPMMVRELEDDNEASMGIPFTEKEEEVANLATAPVTNIAFERRVTPVTDSVQATILGAIENMTNDVEKVVEEPIGRHLARLGDGHITIGIIPDLSSVKLEAEADNTRLITYGRLCLYAEHRK